jgi:lysophospholipase L1-like esterase
VVVLAFGTNDLRYGSSPRAVARRYQALRRRAEAGGAVVYLALTPPVLPPDPDAERIAREVTRLNLMLRETWPSSRLLDFHTGFGPGDFESDGVHVSDAGQRKRAAVARRILAPRS